MNEECYSSLLKEFEATKRELGDTENSIRRITGRNPDEIIRNIHPGGKFRPNAFLSNERKIFYSAREKRKRMELTKDISKESPSADEEESSPDEKSPVKKPSIASTIVAKSNQAKSRKAIIAEQNTNSKLRARNHRIFQALIGTLEKFQSEEKKRQHVVSMRAEIEKKVEATNEEEREEIKKEKKNLFATRKLKLVQLRCLEKKLERAESHEVFENVHKRLCNFIKTKATPPVFFIPAKHTAATKQRLEESKKIIQDLIEKKKAELEADLVEIEESYRIDQDQSTTVPGDAKEENNLEDSNHADLDIQADKHSEDAFEDSEKFEVVEFDENSKDSQSENVKDPKEKSNLKDDTESVDAAENESECAAVEHDDSGPEDEEPPFERNLADSISDQEFEPIYD